jgi:hypothetical protein
MAARASVSLFLRVFMTLRVSPSWACPCVSRILSLTGVLPWLDGYPVAPPAWTDASWP